MFSAEDPSTGHLNPICEALTFAGPFRPVPTPPPIPPSGEEAGVYKHSRAELACARLSAFREGLPGLRSESEPNDRTAAVAAAAAVVRGFYMSVLAPSGTGGKGPALAYLPEELSRVLRRARNPEESKGDRDCLRHVRSFSKMFDSNGLHADRLLRAPKRSREQSEAEDELLVELLRAGQALDSIIAAVEDRDGPAVFKCCKTSKDDGGGSRDDWLGKLAACLVKEANNACKRLRSRTDRSDRQQEEGDVSQLAAAVRRLQNLTKQLVAADPAAADLARGTLLRDTPLYAGAIGATLSDRSSVTASAGVTGGDADHGPLDLLCRHVLLGARGGAGARALDAEHDEILAVCLQAVALREAAAGKAGRQDIGPVCLLWWAAAGLAAEVRCRNRRSRAS
jgi:hypothetical protein